MSQVKVLVTIPAADKRLLETHKARNLRQPFIKVLDFEDPVTTGFVRHALKLVREFQKDEGYDGPGLRLALQDVEEDLVAALEGKELEA